MPDRMPVGAALCAAMLLAAPAAAEDTIIVTATRTPLALEDALAPVVVITGEELRRSATFDVLEAIRFHAGLELGRNGGPGQTASLFIRGSNSNHTLVMIDGVRINPGTLGAAALQHVTPADIDRIEIVKGPRSSLYGTEALGGVVNIITRRAAGPFSADAEASGGSWNTRGFGGGIRGSADGIYGGIRADRTETDGFPTRTGSDIDRGHENTGVRAHLGRRGEAASFELRHWQAQGNTEYLDFLLDPVDQDFENSVTALEAEFTHGARWRSRLLLSRASDEIDQIQSPDFAHTVRRTADWQHDFELSPAHALQAGLFHATERTRSEVFGTAFDERPDARAAYLQHGFATGPWRTQLAVRHTDHDAFGRQWTWNAELGMQVTDTWRAIASAGRGFRAPDSTERFGSGGNPDLEAESSRNLELGVRGGIGPDQRLDLQLFENRIDDLIAFDLGTFMLRNTDRARIRGVELAHSWHRGPWRLRHTLTIRQPLDLNSGELLPRRARRSLGSSMQRRFAGDVEVGVHLLATSRRKDSGFSDDVNAGYLLAGLSARWRFAPGWHADLRIENALDADYETAHGFASPGRSVFVRIAWNH